MSYRTTARDMDAPDPEQGPTRVEIARRRAYLASLAEPVPFPMWKGVLSGLGLTAVIAIIAMIALFLLSLRT